MENTIEKEVLNKILFFMKEGYDDYEFYNFRGATDNFKKAIDLLPEPKNEYKISKNLYTCLAMSYISIHENEKAVDNYREAITCIDGEKDSNLHFMLGKYLYITGNKKESLIYFSESYQLSGEDEFKKHDIKYWNYFNNHKNDLQTTSIKKIKSSKSPENEKIEYKGKYYTKEEWIKYEEKQFLKYKLSKS